MNVTNEGKFWGLTPIMENWANISAPQGAHFSNISAIRK